MSDDDKITKLPIKFKEPPSADGPTLKVVRYEGCNHRWVFNNGRQKNAQYIIREGETEVECGLCKTKLDPMFVLKILAHEETSWGETRKRYQEEMKRLNERKLTKCQHCAKMTRISRS